MVRCPVFGIEGGLVRGPRRSARGLVGVDGRLALRARMEELKSVLVMVVGAISSFVADKGIWRPLCIRFEGSVIDT